LHIVTAPAYISKDTLVPETMVHKVAVPVLAEEAEEAEVLEAVHKNVLVLEAGEEDRISYNTEGGEVQKNRHEQRILKNLVL
jgi:hypothetical protein